MSETELSAAGSLIVLMYHQLFSDRPADNYSVSVGDFESQMSWLSAQGFLSVVPETLSASTAPRQVMITFDDGYASDLDHALPILDGYGFKGVCFITTSCIGTPGHLGWEQLRRIKEAGFSVQSHTHSHPLLECCSPERVRHELAYSKYLLESELGSPVIALSLPGGSMPDRVTETAGQAGYRYVFSSIPGVQRIPPAPDRAMRRFRVGPGLSADGFTRLVSGKDALQKLSAAGYFLRRGVKRVIGAGAYHLLWRAVAGKRPLAGGQGTQ